MKSWVLLFGLIFLTGCESVIDCNQGINPSLEEKQLQEAIRAQAYHETISVDILNSGDTNFAISEVEVIGDLPTGLEVTGNGLTITIQGTPLSIGPSTFEIKVRVGNTIANEDLSDGLCNDTAIRSYTIQVN